MVENWPIPNYTAWWLGMGYKRTNNLPMHPRTDRQSNETCVPLYSPMPNLWANRPCTRELYTNWKHLSPVYVIQPVVKPVVQPDWQPVVSCKRGISGRRYRGKESTVARLGENGQLIGKRNAEKDRKKKAKGMEGGIKWRKRSGCKTGDLQCKIADQFVVVVIVRTSLRLSCQSFQKWSWLHDERSVWHE